VLARLAQRQTGQGSDLQVKLRLIAGVDRVMAAVVRTRRYLVDQQRGPPLRAANHKKLDAQHAHIVQALGDRTRCGDGPRLQFGRQPPRDHLGPDQDAVAVQVVLEREMHHGAVPAAPDEDRALGLERKLLLQHAATAAQVGPGGGEFGAVANAPLPLAVVTQARGLQDSRQQRSAGCLQVLLAVDHCVGCAGNATALKMCFFQPPILRNRQRVRGRRHRPVLGQRVHRRRGNVFKFGRDRTAQLAHRAQALWIQVIGLHMVVADQPGGTFRVGVQHGGAVPHALRCVHEHAAKLPAAHHAQRSRRTGGTRNDARLVRAGLHAQLPIP